MHPARPTYVVTYDVASRLQTFRSGGLSVPHPKDALFGSFHRLLLTKMTAALPDVTIHTIGMSRVRRKIWQQVERRISDMENQVVLSTCQEITDSNPKSEGLVLNINRLFDTDGEMIGHGPRPGFKPLDEQFIDLAQKIAGRSVVLIEDGAFTGGTLRYVLGKLKESSIRVTAVVIGFCCTRAFAVIRETFEGELVIVDPIENLVDWIPDHDLIPFIPNCGRVLGQPSPQGFMPMRTVDGTSCAYPYILPLGKMEKWATIPPEGARDISTFCLEVGIEIFSRIGREDGHQITIGELLKACSRVSMPIEIGAHQAFPPFDTSIVSFLEGLRQRLE